MSSPQRLSRPFRALNSLGSGRAAATRAAKSKAKLQPPGRKRASGGDEGGQKQGKTATAGKDAGERRRRGRPRGKTATAGNRTRVARVAGEHHTTRPRLLGMEEALGVNFLVDLKF